MGRIASHRILFIRRTSMRECESLRRLLVDRIAAIERVSFMNSCLLSGKEFRLLHVTNIALFPITILEWSVSCSRHLTNILCQRVSLQAKRVPLNVCNLCLVPATTCCSRFFSAWIWFAWQLVSIHGVSWSFYVFSWAPWRPVFGLWHHNVLHCALVPKPNEQWPWH